MPVRNFTADDLPALLKFVDDCNTWADRGRDIGLRTFEQTIGQPGFAPEDNCFLLEEDGELRGYCLVISEPLIHRVVLELTVITNLIGTPSEHELIHRGLDRAGELDARVIHLCQPKSSPTAEFLMRHEFVEVRCYWDMVWSHESLPITPIPDGFSVRSFADGDAKLLADVQNSAFAESWGFCPNTVEQVEYRCSMANTSHQGILFLHHGKEPAGYCWTFLTPVGGALRGMIGMIGVVPEYRGKGISRAILASSMEYLRTLDVADIGLQVDGSNTPGVRLYTSIGFEKVGELHWFERKTP